MHDSLRTQELDRTTSSQLLDHGQPLGFLPTWWFWRNKDNVKLVRWPLRIAIGAAFLLGLALDASWWVMGLLPVVFIVGSVGFIERFIRHRALERRSTVAQIDDGGGAAEDKPR